MRIAIVALQAYPAVEPEAGRAVGGLETFAWSFARELAAQPGFQIQLLVRHTSRPERSPVDGVEVVADVEPLRDWRRDVSDCLEVRSGFPWLRLKRLRVDLFWKIPVLAMIRLFRGPQVSLDDRLESLLLQCRPDWVLTLGVGDSSAAAVRATDGYDLESGSILWIRSNADLNPRFRDDPGYVDPYGVKAADAQAAWKADRILCQTELQSQRIRDLLQRNAVVIPNPVDSDRFPLGNSDPASRKGVLWIGRYDRHHKRPHLALEFAQRCPDLPFQLVINRGDPAVEEEIRRLAPPNVTIIDYLSRDEMSRAFREARLFLCTGAPEYEGFPNVLLEAASSGTPIISLEEFDDFLAKSGAGVVEGNLPDTAGRLAQLYADEQEWKRKSQCGAEYVRREHTLSGTIERFVNTITNRSVSLDTLNGSSQL